MTLPGSNDPFTKPEIAAADAASARATAAFFASTPAATFFEGDTAHWGCAHHLAHLTLARRRIAGGLVRRDALPAHTGPAARRMTEIGVAYRAALSRTPAAVLAANPLTPRLDPAATQSDVIDDYLDSAHGLAAALEPWSEVDLDRLAIPHPLMGPISVREMLIFCVYHDQHHVDGVRARLERR